VVNRIPTPAIGVFDSGVGGLTVVRALRHALPAAPISYLGDTARVPYGTKSARTVERYSLACLEFLLGQGADLVLVACNTASANALPALEAASRVPVIGAVEPGAARALAVSQNRRLGVLGTLGTIRSGAYPRAVAARDSAARVFGLACPLLVPLAEEGWIDGEVAEAVARRYLAALFAQDANIDTVVLGCTHYPLLAGVLGEQAERIAGRPIALVDSATAMAEAARIALADRNAEPKPPPGELSIFVTDATRLDELAERFLGEPVRRFELIDL
jgi:glutamate racemase